VRLVGTFDPALDATVIPADEPAAYCLPGSRRFGVVITTGALAALDTPQLIAVLAHERAHLRARHDLALDYVRTLARAFPRVAAFRVAETECARLIEMAADDAASAATARLTVAGALLALSSGPGVPRRHGSQGAPTALLAAVGTTTSFRIRRLIADPPPPSRRLRFAGGTGIGALLLLPLFLAVAPEITSLAERHCQLSPAAGAASTELDT
jgi:hypothetical protein